MDVDQNRLDNLLVALSEGLNVEIERWISTDEPDGIAKVVQGVLALRNRNGGFFIVGFDDKTLNPDLENRPSNVRVAFNLDKIQDVISKYTSDGFEVAVGFAVRDGQEYPVIVVPDGVRSSVAARRDLKDSSEKFLIREGDVYFRTLGSNGTPSTSKARPSDWREIAEICFENRDADIGRFFRRHLAGGNIESLTTILRELNLKSTAPEPSLQDRAFRLLDSGYHRYKTALKGISSEDMDQIKDLGTWSVALVIEPPKEEAIPDRTFLNVISSANPQYTGWPIWLDSRGSNDQSAAPKVIDKAWQALILSLRRDWFQHVDFMRMDPRGDFYLLRVLPDDMTEKVAPRTALDVILVIIRVAEAITVGISFGKALDWQPDAHLGFAFRWEGLAGRTLATWVNPMLGIVPGRTAHDNEVQTFINVPLDTPISAIAPYVQKATRDLFVLFDGYTVSDEAVEHWVQKLIERRL